MRTLSFVILLMVLSVQINFAIADGAAPAVPTSTDPEAKANEPKANEPKANEPKANEPKAKAKDAEDAGKKSLSAALVEPKNYTMGDNVKIMVEGNSDNTIKVSDSKATGVLLVLNDVIMKSIDNPIVERDEKGNLVLSFRLSRDAEKKDSRDEWNKLLETQDEYDMKLPIGLATSTAAVLPVTTSTDNKLLFHITTSDRVHWTIGVGIVFFALSYVSLIKSESFLRDAKGKSYSLAKSQMAFWGLLVFITFIGIWFNTGMPEHIPQQVLILLGISAATGWAALVIGNGAGGAKDSNGFFQDICDDGNGMGFHRLQTVMWSVILGVIFVYDVGCVISMPEFDPNLLWLLGISNGTYLGFKFPEKKV